MMKDILSQRGFSEEEITTLEVREDYEEIRETVERMQADRLLDQLEARTDSTVEQATKSLEERWERFKNEILSLSESEVDGAPDTSTPSETLEEARIRLKNEAVERAESAIRERAEKIPLIGPFLADWLIEEGKELRDDVEASKGFGGMIKKFLFSLAASFLGVKGILGTLDDEIASAQEVEVPIVEKPNSPNIELSSTTGDNLVYAFGIELITGLSDKDNNTTEQLFNQSKVKESSFSAILSEDFKLEEISENDISALQGTLKSQEDLIDSILGNENPDWRNMKLLDIFEEIGVYGKSITSIENINPDELLSGDFSIGDISLNGESFGGTLGTLFERYRNSESSIFHGVSTKLFIEIIRENRKKITDTDVDSLFNNNSFNNTDENPGNEKFEQEFITFGRGFIDTITSEFYLGPPEHRTEFENFIKTRSLSYKEVLEFMILTGGSLEVSGYNDAVKTIIYLKIWKILGEEEIYGNPLRRSTYNHILIQSSVGGVSDGIENVPPQFLLIGKTLLNKSLEAGESFIEQIIDKSMEVLLTAWKESSFQLKAGMIGGSIFMVFIMLRTRHMRSFISGGSIVGGSVLIGGLVALSGEALASQGFKNQFPELDSREKIINQFIKELSANGVDLSEAVEDLRQGRTPHTDIDISAIEATSALSPQDDLVTQESIMEFDTEILKLDSMEIVNLTEATFGNTQITIHNSDLQVYYNGKQRNLFFQSTLFAPPAENIINGHSTIVQNQQGDYYIAVKVEEDNYNYLSIKEIDSILSSGEPSVINNNGVPEYKLYENFFRGWSLFIDGEPRS